jgi:hypothetical protein
VRVSGIFGYQQGDFDGGALSGVALMERGEDQGFRAAGIVTHHSGPFEGGMASGVASIATGSLSGVQASGVASITPADVRGVQLAGVANLARDFEGFQASAANVSGDLRGAQIGVVNIGGRVKGLQLGLVNVADDVDGASIGIVTFSKSGRLQPVAWVSTTSPANVGVRFYTGPLYAMPTLGFDLQPDPAEPGPDVATFAPGFSLGVRLPIQRAFVDVEGNYSNPSPEFRYDEHTVDLRYRAWVGFEVTP